MTPRTNTLASVTGSGPFTTHWFQVPKDQREHRSVVLSLSAGSGTVKIEGRNTSADTPVDVTLTAGGNLIQWFPQMRVTSSDASGVSVIVTIDTPCIDTGA